MSTGKNRKKVLIVGRMPQAGIDALKKRDDVDYEILTDDSVGSLHPKLKDANAVTLGGTAFRQAELDAAPGMMVVARLGVGFDAVEIPALNKRKIPLMTTGIANSVSVAEHAMYMLLASARLTRKHDRFVRDNAWGQRLSDLPADLAGKSILVVGMGRIGSRTVKRCVAFEMKVHVLDKEPPDPTNKLFGLENVIFSPHMAGVTKEASDRMAVTAIENILSVFDGRPNAAHCVNKEVLR